MSKSSVTNEHVTQPYLFPEQAWTQQLSCILMHLHLKRAMSDWITSQFSDKNILHSTIFCRKQFDVIEYVTFYWMKCVCVLQLKTKLQKCIRMGIPRFEIIINFGRYIIGYVIENHVLWFRNGRNYIYNRSFAFN